MSASILTGSLGVLAGELRAPRREAYRIAVRFAIGEHVERLDRAGRIERQPVGDQLHFADHFVDDEPADRAVAGANPPHARLDGEAARLAGDRRLDVGGNQHGFERAGVGECRVLRGVDAQVFDRVRKLGRRRERAGEGAVINH